ncbi:MAG: HDOD domain-containing protein [Candidatus Hydrogenedentes bacterium]|nr:HDOD domain-containing protein [Candidatus Hydrogenedentota bacterium]
MTVPNVRDAVLRIRDLPTLPSVLGKILATAADPDASALDLGKHISADQSLSATLLKLVNSAYYGFYRQIASVSQAIVMLGFLEVRNLTLTATAFRTLGQSTSDYDRVQLWRHSLGTAMAAERLAKLLKMETEGVFESGLLHDIGKVALDMLYPEEFRQAAHRAHAEGRPVHETERQIFGVDHAEIGGILGEHWNLPPAVVEAICCHHAPEQATLNPALAHLIALADALTYQADLGELSNGIPPELPEKSLQQLRLTAGQALEIVEVLKKSQEKIDEFVGALRPGAK